MHSPAPLRTRHVVIAGFLQSCGTANGMSGLWLDLRQKHVSSIVAVEFRAWNDNVDDLAETIWRTARDADVTPAVYVYAYSWGGMTAMNFARALGDRALGVRRMVLSDPVYRDRLYLRRLWQSFNPRAVIRVPGVVDEVDWFRQTLHWPRGHDLVADEAARTDIHPPVVVSDVGHKYMDDLPAFRDRCLQVAEAA